MLANAFLQLVPGIALDNRCIHIYRLDLDAHCLRWSRGGQGQVGNGLNQRAQVFRNFSFVGLCATWCSRRSVTAWQNDCRNKRSRR
jgi:hypothetical protein